MGEWQTASLGDVCTFQAGDAFSKDLQGRAYGEFPVAKVSDMNLAGNELYINRANNWLSKEDLKNGFRLHPVGAVVFAKIGVALTTNRRRVLTRPTAIDNNMMSATSANGVDPKWLYYLLSVLDFNDVAAGSALPYLTVRDLSKIPIEVPPNAEQSAISSTLSALDDKIELNRRMNETLEGMARAIFRDWFVDFGPTRAKMEGRAPYLAEDLWSLFPDKLDDTTGLPEGWEDKPLTHFIDLIGGGTPKTSEQSYWGGEIPWFSVVDTPTGADTFVFNTQKSITQAGLDNSSARLLEAGDTIISARGTVGNLARAGRPMAFNQSCYGLRGQNGYGASFVFLAAKHMVSKLQSLAHGSVFSTITRQTFEAVQLVDCGDELAGSFESVVSDVFDRVKANVAESSTLAETRDYLLPKLMSGEIRVRDAKAMVGGAA